LHAAAKSHATATAAAAPMPRPTRALVIDIGGTSVKLLVAGETERRKFPSGKDLTPSKLVARAKRVAKGWQFDGVSIGFPGIAGRDGPTAEPGNLGKGWVGYDFAAAFGCPVKIANDAAMQALGSYGGGRMLFMGLGTGIGGALVVDRTIIPVELGALPWRRDRETLAQALGSRGLDRVGARTWRKMVEAAAQHLMKAFLVDYVVLGGGNAKKLREVPAGLRIGHNQAAFRGGLRLWSVEDIPPQSTAVTPSSQEVIDWRVL
jgi:polyphosphate glucokinase